MARYGKPWKAPRLPGANAPQATGSPPLGIERRELKRLVKRLIAYDKPREVEKLKAYAESAEDFGRLLIQEIRQTYGIEVPPSLAAIVTDVGLHQLWGRHLSDRAATEDNADLAVTALKLIRASSETIARLHELARTLKTEEASQVKDPLAHYLDMEADMEADHGDQDEGTPSEGQAGAVHDSSGAPSDRGGDPGRSETSGGESPVGSVQGGTSEPGSDEKPVIP